jgi:hypothetical protein
MISRQSHFFSFGSRAPSHSFYLNIALAGCIPSKRREQRALIYAQRIARRGLFDFALGDYTLASFIDDAHLSPLEIRISDFSFPVEDKQSKVRVGSLAGAKVAFINRVVGKLYQRRTLRAGMYENRSS